MQWQRYLLTKAEPACVGHYPATVSRKSYTQQMRHIRETGHLTESTRVELSSSVSDSMVTADTGTWTSRHCQACICLGHVVYTHSSHTSYSLILRKLPPPSRTLCKFHLHKPRCLLKTIMKGSKGLGSRIHEQACEGFEGCACSVHHWHTPVPEIRVTVHTNTRLFASTASCIRKVSTRTTATSTVAFCRLLTVSATRLTW